MAGRFMVVSTRKIAPPPPPPTDSTPDQFTFVDQNDVPTSSVITSAPITVTGINIPSAISIIGSGGAYDINGSGSFSSSPGSVNNGDTVRARITSNAANSTATSTTVTIGGVSDSFTATTVAAGGGTDLWSSILTSTRGTDWTRAGVRGGVPHRTTKDGTTIVAGTSTATINARIAAAVANTYLEFGAGTFNLTGLTIARSDITLRGQGAHLTFFVFSGVSGHLGLQASAACGSQFMSMDAPDNSANFTVGLTRGSTVITLSSVANLTVGKLMILNQLNDASPPANDIVTGSSLPFSYDGGGGGGFPGNREHTETVEVTAINGLNVTITPGIRSNNFSAGRSPRAWWNNTAPLKGIGIEDISFDHGPAGVGSGGRGIAFLGVKDCWVARCKSRFAPRNHCWIYQSMNCTYRDSFLFEGQSHASQSYGVETGDSPDCLTENNISVRVTSAWMMSGCSIGCVRAYNFSILDTFSGDWMQGSNYFHCTGSAYVLDEGNITPGFISDQVHGPSSLVTAFRNQFEGWESGKAQQTTPIHIYTYSRYFNIIGNVLGRQGVHTNYESNPVNGLNGYVSIYTLGWGDNASHGGGGMPADDIFVATSLMRWGNCEPINGFVGRFISGEVPSAITGAFDNPVPVNNVLPASFFHSSRPAFFGSSIPWPPIGPDVTGGDIANKGGRAYSIPAKALYDAATKDGQGEITFDGNAYYL